MTELTHGDISMIRSVVDAHLAARSRTHATSAAGQPMLSEAIELIGSQVMLPILVSVTSSQLQDLLKHRKLRNMSRRETRDLAESAAGRSIATNIELHPAERAELRVNIHLLCDSCREPH